jgi:hypothetical protein
MKAPRFSLVSQLSLAPFALGTQVRVLVGQGFVGVVVAYGVLNPQLMKVQVEDAEVDHMFCAMSELALLHPVLVDAEDIVSIYE